MYEEYRDVAPKKLLDDPTLKRTESDGVVRLIMNTGGTLALWGKGIGLLPEGCRMLGLTTEPTKPVHRSATTPSARAKSATTLAVSPREDKSDRPAYKAPTDEELWNQCLGRPAETYLNNSLAKFVVGGVEYTRDEFIKNRLDEDAVSEVRVPSSCGSCGQPWGYRTTPKIAPNPAPPPTAEELERRRELESRNVVVLDAPYSPTIYEYVKVACCDNPSIVYKSYFYEVTAEIDVPKPAPDLAQIQRAYDILVAPLARIVELRAVKTAKGVYSGFYNSAEIVKDTFDLSAIETTPNCYWTIQTLKPDARKVENNAHPNCGKGDLSNDKMIASFAYIPVDYDPIRKGTVSSTDREKESAYNLAEKVRPFLADRDIQVIFADSGNGYHHLIPVLLPNTADTVLLIKNLLEALTLWYE